MQAGDFRSIGRVAQKELRRRALFLIERQGLSQGQAAQLVGVHRQTVNTWVKRHREQGEDGVLDGRRVSPRRGKGVLSADEASRVRAWIVGQPPDKLELPFGLWTSRAVREVIERRFGKRLGLTPQKPLVRARQRQPAAVAAWLATSYPAIAKRAKAMRAVIYWGDETGVSNHRAPAAPDPSAELARTDARAGDQIGRSCAPKGQTPAIARTAKRTSRRMISVVNNRGLMRFMLYEGALNADPFIAFLRRLIKDAERKVILIVDDLKVHKVGKITAWVESHAHEIELCYLPSDAPDHNPSEYLDNDLKQPHSGSEQKLIERTPTALRAIQRSPERVRAYFRPEPVRYAA